MSNFDSIRQLLAKDLFNVYNMGYLLGKCAERGIASERLTRDFHDLAERRKTTVDLQNPGKFVDTGFRMFLDAFAGKTVEDVRRVESEMASGWHHKRIPVATFSDAVFGTHVFEKRNGVYVDIDKSKYEMLRNSAIENDIYRTIYERTEKRPVSLLNLQIKKRVIIEDFDKTNYDGIILGEFMVFAADRGKIDAEYAVKFHTLMQKTGWGTIGYETFAQESRKLLGSMLRGRSQKWFVQLVDQFFAEREKQAVINPLSYQMHEISRKTAYPVLVTAEPMEIAKPLGKYLSVGTILATEFETDSNGRYTGRTNVNTMNTISRINEIMRYITKSGVNPASTIAVGDSSSDKPMFEIVGFPVVRNPGEKMTRWAEENNYLIVRDTDSAEIYEAYINNPLSNWHFVSNLSPGKRGLIQRVYADPRFGGYGGDWGRAIADVERKVEEGSGLSGMWRRWLYSKDEKTNKQMVEEYKDIRQLRTVLYELCSYERTNDLKLNVYDGRREGQNGR